MVVQQKKEQEQQDAKEQQERELRHLAAIAALVDQPSPETSPDKLSAKLSASDAELVSSHKYTNISSKSWVDAQYLPL